MGFKTSDVPLAERSAACLLLLELESRGLAIEGADGWVAASPDRPIAQEYTDSDWLDHRSAKNGRS
jgi:alkanesulfonate monooxygenase SsuD/methylene tetrahydromethanopterin reductase-like flavin-dependent oxidoreductase (luciferase family)